MGATRARHQSILPETPAPQVSSTSKKSGKSSKKGASRKGKAQPAAIPSTPAEGLAFAPASPSPKQGNRAAGFYGAQLPRPTLVLKEGKKLDADAELADVLQDGRSRVHYVSPVGSLMEWAAGAPAKANGVAPQWVGRPPRASLTPQRAFLEDRRAALLADDPDLKLLPYGEQLKLATQAPPHSFRGLSQEEQEKYRKFAKADATRYEEEAARFEAIKANKHWRAYQAAAKAQRAKRGRSGKPWPPPEAHQLFAQEWLAAADQDAADVSGDQTVKEAAAAKWEELPAAERAEFERRAEEAARRYGERLTAWKTEQKARRSARRAARAAAAAAEGASDFEGAEEAAPSGDEAGSSSDEDSEDGDSMAAIEAAAEEQMVQQAEGRGGRKRASDCAAPAAEPAAKKARGSAAAASKAAEGSSTAAKRPAAAAAANSKAAPAGKAAAAAAAATKAARAPQSGAAVAAKARRQSAEQPAAAPESAVAAAAEAPRTPASKRKAAARAPPAAPGSHSVVSRTARRTAAREAAPKPTADAEEGVAAASAKAAKQTKELGGRTPTDFPTDPGALVGAAVHSGFEMRGADGRVSERVFSGVVKKYLVARIQGQGYTPLWDLAYEDGDEEEVEWMELKELLKVWPPASYKKRLALTRA